MFIPIKDVASFADLPWSIARSKSFNVVKVVSPVRCSGLYNFVQVYIFDQRCILFERITVFSSSLLVRLYWNGIGEGARGNVSLGSSVCPALR
jgi:hypothetical protein